MKVFLDFEASSLAKRSYPIEVAWVFEDGRSESHLLRPAPGWDDWASDAEAIHGISRETLLAEGRPIKKVARHMIETLGGHDLLASAPSWDGKWLSVLLRGARLPRHALRLRDTELLWAEEIVATLRGHIADEDLYQAVDQIVTQVKVKARTIPVAHRALADAEVECARWREVRAAAEAWAAGLAGKRTAG